MRLQFPLNAAIISAVFKDRADLIAENVAPRHQLFCLKHLCERPKLQPRNRALRGVLPRLRNRRHE